MSNHESTTDGLGQTRERIRRLEAVVEAGLMVNSTLDLAELGVLFALALTTANLHCEIVAREQLKREVNLAAEIQRALQPEGRADIPGLEIEVLFEPCHEVGGDYWDVIPVDVDRWWIVVADVSGKGVPAGLVASNFQACLWARRTGTDSLTSIIADV